ncbi:SRPBCC family protein [Nonomuraea polychroma]|uniref:SRPBCC family protein n=1 Tax=Nonomuraea polychroma TaxID=46176 RepID=UPI003D8F381E
MHFETTIDIDAPLERIWRVMTDIARWPAFMPTVTSVERLGDGPLALGGRIRIKQPGLPALVWRVTEFDEGSSFGWRSAGAGLTTVAGHTLTPRAAGASLRLTIDQSGPAAPLIGLLTKGRTTRYVRTEAESIKRRCER